MLAQRRYGEPSQVATTQNVDGQGRSWSQEIDIEQWLKADI